MAFFKKIYNCLVNCTNFTKKWFKRIVIVFVCLWVLIPGSSLWSVWAIDKVWTVPISVKSSISLTVLRINQNLLEFNLSLANPHIIEREHIPIESSDSTQYTL